MLVSYLFKHFSDFHFSVLFCLLVKVSILLNMSSFTQNPLFCILNILQICKITPKELQITMIVTVSADAKAEIIIHSPDWDTFKAGWRWTTLASGQTLTWSHFPKSSHFLGFHEDTWAISSRYPRNSPAVGCCEISNRVLALKEFKFTSQYTLNML